MKTTQSKKCKICDESFDSNTRTRKYCFTCSPQIGKKTLIDTLPIHTCKSCNRQYNYQHGKGHTKDSCNSCSANNRRFKKKLQYIEYKGNKCQVCGYNKCNSNLCFHHLDPNKKDFNLSGNHTRSWEVIKPELDKCIMLCMNCHGEFHAGLFNFWPKTGD